MPFLGSGPKGVDDLCIHICPSPLAQMWDPEARIGGSKAEIWGSGAKIVAFKAKIGVPGAKIGVSLFGQRPQRGR